jgi:hypothetical protein
MTPKAIRSAGRPRAVLALVAVSGLTMVAVAPGAGTAAESAGGKACAPGSKDCAFCESYTRFARALARSTREVGALPDGVVIHYRSDDPETVVELQRFGFERQKLRQAAAAGVKSVRLCEPCRQVFARIRGASFDVANSVHGVFSVITSADPEVVKILHQMASEETQKGVRGS